MTAWESDRKTRVTILNTMVIAFWLARGAPVTKLWPDVETGMRAMRFKWVNSMASVSVASRLTLVSSMLRDQNRVELAHLDSKLATLETWIISSVCNRKERLINSLLMAAQ